MGRTTKWAALVLGVIVVLAVASVLDAGALYFVSMFLLMLPVGARVLGTLSVRSLGASVMSPRPVTAGDNLELVIEATNLGALPRFNIVILTELPHGLSPAPRSELTRAEMGSLTAARPSGPPEPTSPGSSSAERQAVVRAGEPGAGGPDAGGNVRASLPFVQGAGRALARCRLIAERRGCFKVGPLSLLHSDVLGLTEVRRRLSATYEVLVYPRPLGVSLMPLLGGDLAGSERTARSRGAVDGADFYGVRPYRAGDEWRRIHWKTTARVGQLMVIEREELATLSLVVILDLAAAPGDSMTAPLEILLSLTARLTEDAIRRMTLLDLIVLKKDGAVSPLLSHCPDWGRAMETLARLDPDAELPPQPVTSLPGLAGMGPSVVILTDRLDSRVAAAAEVCRECSWPGAVVVLASGPAGDIDPGPVGGVLPVWKLTPVPSPDGDPRKSDYDVQPLARL